MESPFQLRLDNQSIFDRAAEIYAELQRKGELIEDADILIASIADTRNFTLVSDDSDFDKIQGLWVENFQIHYLFNRVLLQPLALSQERIINN